MALMLLLPCAGLRADAPVPASTSSEIRLSLDEAVLMALANNRGMRVERLKPDIAATSQDTANAVFDPDLKVELSRSRDGTDTDSTQGGVKISKLFSPGTALALDVSGKATEAKSGVNAGQARAGLSVTQPLLQGAGPQVNLARVRQAEIDAQASQYEFRGFVEAFVASVSDGYWSVVLAEKRIAILERSSALAQQQLEETKISIKVGALAPSELPAAEAEVAQRRSSLIDAAAELALARLRLMRLVNPTAGGLGSSVTLTDSPEPYEFKLGEPAAHVRTALSRRPEMNQARLASAHGELEVVQARNGRLPKLDTFITLGQSGYASQFSSALNDVGKDDNNDMTAGITFSYPLFQRAEKAGERRAVLRRAESDEALANLAQLVELDVRSSMIRLERDLAAIEAASALRRLREESLRSETEKFKNGRSTALAVGQAQRDLLASEVAELEARIKTKNDVVQFQRFEGTLLTAHGLNVPGADPLPEPGKPEAPKP